MKLSVLVITKKIARHEKKLGFYEWSIKIEHYFNTLKRKPGSLASSTAMQQADPRIQFIYNTYYNKREKDFIELLLFIGEKKISDVQNAINLLTKINPTDITTEKIKSICNRADNKYIENNTVNINMNIEIESDNLLGVYKNLIPASVEEFNSEVAVI